MSSNLVVSQVMKNILVVNIDSTLNTIMKQINWNHYACIVVIDDDNCMFGIITRQLIGYASKRKMNFQAVQAWEVCTPNIITIPADTTLKEAIEYMIDNRVRHLIIKEDNKYTGVITPLDILSLINWDDPEKLAVNS